MSLAATILIPTHDHADTLRASVASALRQTVSDIEVFVIGDGAPDATREIMREFMAADSRVRFFDHPKGPRHGEIYRHEALAQARGRIVCYLSDDDLHLPRHVQEMDRLLQQADFAHALATDVRLDGSLCTRPVDLSLPAYQQELIENHNRVGLSAGAHTMEAYRRLAAGWTTAPASVATDQHMWRKFLEHPGCRIQAGWLPTVLYFNSLTRRHMNPMERYRELQPWLHRIADEAALTALTERILGERARDAAETDARLVDTPQSLATPVLEFMLQVFFPGETAHSEKNSIRVPLRLRESVHFEWDFFYPATSVPVRIDPGDWPGLIQFIAIHLRATDGTVLWQLDEQTSGQVFVGGTAVLFSANRDLQLVSHGRDPQVLLPPLALPAGGQPVRLQLTMRIDADVWALAAAFSAHLAQG